MCKTKKMSKDWCYIVFIHTFYAVWATIQSVLATMIGLFFTLIYPDLPGAGSSALTSLAGGAVLAFGISWLSIPMYIYCDEPTCLSRTERLPEVVVRDCILGISGFFGNAIGSLMIYHGTQSIPWALVYSAVGMAVVIITNVILLTCKKVCLLDDDDHV